MFDGGPCQSIASLRGEHRYALGGDCVLVWDRFAGPGQLLCNSPKRSRYSFGVTAICCKNARRSACSSRNPVIRAIRLNEVLRSSRCCIAASTRSDCTQRAGVVLNWALNWRTNVLGLIAAAFASLSTSSFRLRFALTQTGRSRIRTSSMPSCCANKVLY